MRKLTRNWLRWRMKEAGESRINRHISRTYRDWKDGKLKFKKKQRRRKAA